MPDDVERVPLEADPRWSRDRHFDASRHDRWSGAVLLADEIRYYCTQVPQANQMIDPFKDGQLRPASYQLRLGKEAHIGGEVVELGDEPIQLKPHQVAVVSTEETLNIPRFLIGRWNLRVSNIYDGLLWTGGAQVDPGWTGKLYCPVYNLSENKRVFLKRLAPFFTIDFVRTTALTPIYRSLPDEGLSKVWFKPEKHTLEDHDKNRLHSAPYEILGRLDRIESDVAESRRQIQGAQDEMREFRSTSLTLLGVLLTAVGAVVAGLAVMATFSVSALANQSATTLFTLALAVSNLLLSGGALLWIAKTNDRVMRLERRQLTSVATQDRDQAQHQ